MRCAYLRSRNLDAFMSATTKLCSKTLMIAFQLFLVKYLNTSSDLCIKIIGHTPQTPPTKIVIICSVFCYDSQMHVSDHTVGRTYVLGWISTIGQQYFKFSNCYKA